MSRAVDIDEGIFGDGVASPRDVFNNDFVDN